MHWQRYVHARQGTWPDRLGYDRAAWRGDSLREHRRAIEAWEAGATVPDPEAVAVLAHVIDRRFRLFFQPRGAQ